MNPLAETLRRIAEDLHQLGEAWSLIGDLAVSARAEPHNIEEARAALRLIEERGFHRGKSLLAEFDSLVA